MKTIPDFFEMYDEPIAGIRDIADITCKTTKDFAVGLAEHIAEHNALYYRGRANDTNRQLLTFDSQTHCVEPISCPGAFIRSHVKKRDRHLVTEEVEDKVIDLLFDRENGFAAPLPPREAQYCAFLNGYYNMNRGKFFKDRNFPGFQRFAVQARFMKKKHCIWQLEKVAKAVGSEEGLNLLLRCIGPLLSGYPVRRNMIWCHPDAAELFQLMLVELLPQTGAVIELKVTNPTPDFQQAAKADSHSVVVHIMDASVLTTSAWKKLLLLAEAEKPVLIVAPFLPFMSHDADPDGRLKRSLCLIPADMNAEAIICLLRAEPEMISVLASESIRVIFESINMIEPDTTPDIEALFTRPDPSDISAMAAEFLKIATVETETDSDIIELKNDFCVKLSRYVEGAGGDPKKVSHQGLGVYFKQLGVLTDDVKPHGHKSKVKCLIKRKWNANYAN